MAADGQVVFEIQGDNKGLKNTLQDTTSAIEKESKKWDDSASGSAKGMEQSFGGALKGIAAAFAASQIGKFLVDFGKQAISAASDLEEVQNVVDVTFGESANEINAWAKNAINQFGLTETQAKRFASTMGAMMKSSGIASKDITDMSENLAGLAADMASFYNLDFDEAFNKIRSGISGETEPLKQLGINMSVANLEAFALAQGIDKAFSKMSQSEQIMIRYQYLMQATADAQGDFARTSDGFANGLRLLQSNFEQLKTTVGSLLLPIISDAIAGLNDMMALLIPATKQTTVLDDFANIDLQTQQKLDDIKATKEKADALVKILGDIEKAKVIDKAADIEEVAKGANVLNTSAGSNWSTFISGLNGVGGVISASKGGTQAGTDLGNLAKGGETLTGTPVSTFKYDNLPAKIQELLNKSGKAETLKSELSTVDQEAGKLTKDKKEDFKYDPLIGDLGELEGAANSASKDVPKDLKTLDDGTKDTTTKKTTDFKFSALETDLGELKEVTGTASTDVPDDLKKLDNGTKDITKKSSKDDFKYSTLEGQLTGFQGTTKTAAEKIPGNVNKVEQSANKLTGNAETFKYENVKSGLSELDSAANISKTNQTDTKLADVADSAMKIAEVNYQSNGSVGNLAKDFKILDSTDKKNWESVLNVFNNIPGYTEKIDSKTIESIAGAFAGLGGDKAKAWETLMGALGSDLTALQALTGKDENGAAAWLEAMKEAANGLSNEDVNAWNALFSLLVSDAEGADKFLNFEDIVKAAQSLGVMDTMMVQVGDKTMTVAQANDMYKESMKRLVQLYPELNDLIDTETGEVKGGTTAIQERIDAIVKQHEKEVLLYGIQQKRAALEKKFAELPSLRVDAAMAQNAVKAMQADYDKALERLKELGAYLTDEGNWEVPDIANQEEVIQIVENVIDKYEELVDASDSATKAYEEQQSAYDEASKQYDELAESVEGVTKAQEDGAVTAKTYTDEQKKAAEKGVKKLKDALEDVNDYIVKTRKSMEDSIENSFKGFKKFETAEEHLKKLKKESQAEEKKWNEQEQKAAEQAKKNNQPYVMKKFTGGDDIPTLQNMTKALESEAAFMEEYQSNLLKAKSKGLSDELIAYFAENFSQESADYLHLIVSEADDSKQLQAFKNAYQKMSEAKEPLTNSLTELALQADKEFNELINQAKEAAIKLNNNEIAKESMQSTVEGIAEGIGLAVPKVKEAVDELNAELDRLGDVSTGNIFSRVQSGLGINLRLDGSHANGLDYVPFNNYLAYLHEGESILTAEEAAIWRNFKNGGSGIANTIDYGRLSGAIWDNAPQMGGNVYLDGRTVGRVISAQQANNFRSLERSGWQG